MARPTRGTVATLSANGGSTAPHTLSVTVPASGSLLIYVAFRRSTTEDVTAISRDGQTPSLFATEGSHNGTGWATRCYYLTSANEGTADLSVTLSANRNTRIIAIPYSGVDTGGTPWGTPTRESDLSTAYGASVTADQELIAFAGAYDAAAAAGSFTPTGTGQNELDDNRINDIYAAASYQHETGTVTASWTFGAATADETSNWLVTINGAAPAGPTITVQPVADVGLINGDASRRTTVYTATATGTNVLAPTWSEDATPIADGGIYDIQTTGAGTGECSSTLTITRTAKTGTPFDIAANFEDDDGNTDTDTVSDTWYTGPTLSASSGVTNGSGVNVITISSDYPNNGTPGEYTEVTATCDGVEKSVALVFQTPP